MRTLDLESQTTHNRINLIKYLARESSMSKKLNYIERYEKRIVREDVSRVLFLATVWIIIAIILGISYIVSEYVGPLFVKQ